MEENSLDLIRLLATILDLTVKNRKYTFYSLIHAIPFLSFVLPGKSVSILLLRSFSKD